MNFVAIFVYTPVTPAMDMGSSERPPKPDKAQPFMKPVQNERHMPIRRINCSGGDGKVGGKWLDNEAVNIVDP